MPYVINPPSMGIDTTVIDTAQKFTLGFKIQDNLGTVYQYVKVTASSLLVGRGYIIPSDFTVTTGISHANMGSGANPSKIGIAQISGITTGTWAWLAVQGPMTVYANAAIAANAKIYTCATAGEFDDASASQTLIGGLYLPTLASGAGTASAVAVVELCANSFA